MTKLEEAEARRAKRKAALDEQYQEQRVKDLEEIEALETELGDSNVKIINLPFTPGLPTFVAVRTPNPDETKRYRDSLKPKKSKGEDPDAIAPAVQLGLVCRAFPRKGDGDELFAEILKARPGLDLQMGVEASKLASGNAEAEGKG